MILSPKFEDALVYATIAHAHQHRKGTGIPYVSHLLAVASLVLEYGGDEEAAIGALLHDAGEDAGGAGRIDDIRVRFGDAVADIVDACTDTVENPKPEWRPRKEKYIAQIAQKSEAARLVSAADKLHNSRAILRDLRRIGDDIWSRFTATKRGTLSYYNALTDAFKQAGSNELVEELDRTVSAIFKKAGVERKAAQPVQE
jgi:(p)ppGpp synthase/HD superfamily hydrolase